MGRAGDEMTYQVTALQADDFWPLLQEHLDRWRLEKESSSLDQGMSVISDWLLSLGSEFWSAIAGAVVGGVIAYMLHKSALRESRRERASISLEAQKALGHSLLFKTIRVFEGLNWLKAHVEEAEKQVTTTVPLAAVMTPIANVPDKVAFSPEEMAMLLSLEDDDVFNQLMLLEAVHNGILPVWERYPLLREKYQQLSKADHFDSQTGAATITVQPGSPLEIAIFEANQVARELASRAHSDTAGAKDAVIALQSLLSRKLGFRVGLSFTTA